MKCKTILILLIISVSFGKIFAQDTVVIILPGFKSVKEFEEICYNSLNDTIHVIKCNSKMNFSEEDSISHLLSTRGPYCVFYDNKKRIIQETVWDGENYAGKFILYYKNGHVKETGFYEGNQKIGKWQYYNKKGLLISTVEDAKAGK